MTGWPAAPAEAAFHGPAGEFVLRTEPHSEAHPMALLAQFLVAFGTACGRGAHYHGRGRRSLPERVLRARRAQREGTQGLVLGARPPRARRRRPRLRAAAAWRAASAPGEGLIAQVRDAVDEHRRGRAGRQAPARARAGIRAGPEGPLPREGNTLSPIVRQAWDGDALQTMVRNNPLRASAAHIGVIGHITKDELLRYLTATELANGFLNRFLLIAVDRSKLLPFGSALDADQLAEVRDAVRLAPAVRRRAPIAPVRRRPRASGGSPSTRSSQPASPDWPVPRPRAPRRTSCASR